MSNNLNNILPGNNQDADKEKLLQELHEELGLGDDAFEKDAAEGLQKIPAPHLNDMVQQLNTDLEQRINKKKKKKRGIPDQSAVHITIITILLLIAIAFIIIRKAM